MADTKPRIPQANEYVALNGIVYRTRKVTVKNGRVRDVILRPQCTVEEFAEEAKRRFPRPAGVPVAETPEPTEQDVLESLGG